MLCVDTVYIYTAILNKIFETDFNFHGRQPGFEVVSRLATCESTRIYRLLLMIAQHFTCNEMKS